MKYIHMYIYGRMKGKRKKERSDKYEFGRRGSHLISWGERNGRPEKSLDTN